MAEARSAIHALDVKQVIFSVPGIHFDYFPPSSFDPLLIHRRDPTPVTVRNQLDLYVSNDGVIIYLPHPKLWARNGIAVIDRAWKR
jgi:hypothetical protein